MNRQLPCLLGDGVRLEKVLYVEASNTMIMQLTLTKLRQRDISAAPVGANQIRTRPRNGANLLPRPQRRPMAHQRRHATGVVLRPQQQAFDRRELVGGGLPAVGSLKTVRRSGIDARR